MSDHMIIVEPHADDAYLSLHDHILRWKRGGFRITIVTVQSAVENRAEEALAYAKAVGVEWYGMGFGYAQLPTAADLDFSSIPNYDPSSSLLIGPLGVQHPDHLYIAKLLFGLAHLSYFDIPYYTKQKNQENVNQILKHQTLHSLYIPHHGKRKFFTLFKSQSGFFFYNRPPDLCRIPEIVIATDAADDALARA
jgi:hypothetical protein